MKFKIGNKSRNFLTASVRTVDEENYRITHTVNTKALDRYNTVVLPRGAEVAHFLSNAVVLWHHNTERNVVGIPIGKCVDLSIREDEIVCTTEFNRKDPLAVRVFEAYRDGFMNAWSIGFIPKAFTEITPDNMEEINKTYNLNLKITQAEFAANAWWGYWVIHKWDMLEYSAVPVPGNPEALSDEDVDKFSRELVSRGLMNEDEVRRINFRDLMKKREENTGEGTEQASEGAVSEDQSSEETVTETTQTEGDVTEEGTAVEAPAEEVNSEEATSEETTDNASEGTEETVTPTEEVTETEAKPEDSTVSTSDEQETNPESVAEELTSENSEVTELKAEVKELTQMKFTLSERIAKLESRLAEHEATKELVVTLRAELDTVKKSVEVDNIENIRKIAQTKSEQGGAENFFSNLLGKR